MLLLAAPAELPASPSVVPATATTRTIARVWLAGEGLDEAALAEAVATRLSDKEVLTAGQTAAAIDGPVALCHVRARDGKVVLELILADGRVYQREIAAKGNGRERAAARLISATLAAIEDETARPDRSDGVFVAPVAEPREDAPVVVVPPPVASEPSVAVPEPTNEPTSGEPAPAIESPAPVRERPTVALPAPVASPTLELGVALELGALFGLGAPPAGAGLAGGGGGVRVDLKLRGGVLLGAGFRGHARLRDELALGRFRGAVGVGYLLRRGRFELAALVGPTLETWQAFADGEPVTYTTTSSSGASLLLGGFARAAPGVRVRGARVSARFGGYVELAGSARSSGRAAQIARAGGQAPVFVLGGAELSVGVEVELWIALRRARGLTAHGR